jgi:hypothetical protein
MFLKRKIIDDLFIDSLIVKNKKRFQNIIEHKKQIDDVKNDN